jgi:hypothetical protein
LDWINLAQYLDLFQNVAPASDLRKCIWTVSNTSLLFGRTVILTFLVKYKCLATSYVLLL